MRKWVVPLMCLMLLATGGCIGKGDKESPAPENPKAEVQPGKIQFEPYDISKAPGNIAAEAEKNKTRETASFLEGGGRFWLLLTRGQKPTGGYDIQVTEVYLDVLDNGHTVLKVSYKHVDPAPGQVVTQVLTYPVELVLLKDLKVKPDEVIFKLVGKVPPKVNMSGVSDSFRVSVPKAGDVVTSPIKVVGKARVFEAAFQVKLEDIHGNTLAETNAMASKGAPEWGDFKLSVAYKPAKEERTGMLKVYALSPKDGSVLDMVTIPLKLK